MLPGVKKFVELKLVVKFKGPVDAVKLWLVANATVGKARAKSVNNIVLLIFTPPAGLFRPISNANAHTVRTLFCLRVTVLSFFPYNTAALPVQVSYQVGNFW